ncbi:MAG: hypothetical protein ACI8W8_003333 [Rhodothermales bacterium]|jgi:hypothetical protein
MKSAASTIAVLGTLDSKGEEHAFVGINDAKFADACVDALLANIARSAS